MIGVISDTHIPRRSDELPLEVIEGFKGVEMILHAGDLTDESVIEKLEKIAPVYAVQGNVDHPTLKEILPRKRIVEYKGFRIGLMHGHGDDGYSTLSRVLNAFKDDNVHAVVFGHSHKPVNERVNGMLVFNPGSPTDKRFEMYYSYGLLIPQEDKLVGKVKYFK